MKIAITGTLGGGKSSASRYLLEKGYPVYDADKLVHDFYLKDGVLYQAMIDLLGSSIVDADGTLNRQKIANLVFKDRSRLQAVESLVFPAVLSTMQALYQKHEGLVFFEVPLLFESDMAWAFDCIICISAPLALRLERLKGRGMTQDDALARMARHTPEAIKREQSDFFINNDGLPAALNAKIDDILKVIMKGVHDA